MFLRLRIKAVFLGVIISVTSTQFICASIKNAIFAIKNSNLQKLKIELFKGINPNNPSPYDGEILLHKAASFANEEIVRFLISMGSAINAPSYDGTTPLHWSAIVGNIETSKELLKLGADLSSQDYFGVTPLMKAIQRGNRDYAFYLLDTFENELNLDLVDFEGLTALHWATIKGNIGILERLIELNADVLVLDNSNASLLHKAVSHGRFEILKILIEHGVSKNINVIDDRGRTPLQWVMRMSEGSAQKRGALMSLKMALNMIIELRKYGADEEITDNDNKTPLDWIEKKHLDNKKYKTSYKTGKQYYKKALTIDMSNKVELNKFVQKISTFEDESRGGYPAPLEEIKLPQYLTCEKKGFNPIKIYSCVWSDIYSGKLRKGKARKGDDKKFYFGNVEFEYRQKALEYLLSFEKQFITGPVNDFDYARNSISCDANFFKNMFDVSEDVIFNHVCPVVKTNLLRGLAQREIEQLDQRKVRRDMAN